MKNRHLLTGLRDAGLDVTWLNTLNLHPRTVAGLVSQTVTGTQFIVSASTKVRLGASGLLYPKLRSDEHSAVLLPMGGQLHEEVDGLPWPGPSLYRSALSKYDLVLPETDRLNERLTHTLDHTVTVETLPNLRSRPSTGPDIDHDDTSSLETVYVGRIKRTKGLTDAIDAVARCRAEGRDVTLDIYGQFLPGDDYEDAFLEQCSETSGVAYRGRIPDGEVIETLRDFDVFLFPTYYEGEGFPGAIIEAYMAGCAVVATRWRSNPEIVDHGQTGLLTEPQNVDALQERLTELYTDSELLREMQAEAWDRSEQYSVEQVTGELLEKLDERGWDV